MERPVDKIIYICAVEVPWVKHSPITGNSLYRHICSHGLSNTSSHEPLAGMHFKLT